MQKPDQKKTPIVIPKADIDLQFDNTNYRNGQVNIPDNNQMGKFSKVSRSRDNPKHVRTLNSNMFGLRVKTGKKTFLPGAPFHFFADMLNKYGNSSRFDKSFEEIENMFRGVETSDQLIRQIGFDMY